MFCATSRLSSSACLQTALKRSAAAIAARNGANTKFVALQNQQLTTVASAGSSILSSKVNKFSAASHFSTTPARTMSGMIDHATMWKAERVVSAAQIPAFIVPFIWTTPVTDAIFCTLLVVHSHWGIEAIVVDYIRPKLFGGSTVIPNICVALVWALSAVTLGGLFYFNYTDVGIVNAIKMLWTKV